MPTKETIESKLKDFMRSHDEVGKRTFRMILAAIQLAEVEKRAALDESAISVILQKEAKMRNEAIVDAEKAGRAGLAEDSRAELALIQSMLPKSLSPEELEAIIRKAVLEAGASTPGEMGKVMKLVTPQTLGRADNREVSQLVRKLLGG
jgi:uncharacterized protein